MKTSIKTSIMLLIGASITYTACHKDNNIPKGITNQDISAKVAANITKSFNGSFGGGFVPTDGVQTITATSNGGKLMGNATTVDLCSYTSDVPVHSVVTVDTTQITTDGRIISSFICTTGTPSGINKHDSLNVVSESSNLHVINNFSEKLTILTNTFSDPSAVPNYTLNGYINIINTSQYKPGSITVTELYNYVITDMKMDGTGINSGTATFHTKGNNAKGETWEVTGTITFLSGNKATITINGSTFNADLGS